MTPYVIEVSGFDELGDFESLSRSVKDNLKNAVNRTIDRARTIIDRDIRENVNLSKSHLARRMSVVKRATAANPEAVLKATDDPFGLAGFATSKRRGGVRVEVTPGDPKTMKRAFLLYGDKVLAIRLKPGESFKNKKYARQVDSGLYALYGPSVDQAFATFAEERADDLLDLLENEFNRLQELPWPTRPDSACSRT